MLLIYLHVKRQYLGKFVLFADDTNLFVEGETAEEAFKKANEVLSALNVYMILNKLHINMKNKIFRGYNR